MKGTKKESTERPPKKKDETRRLAGGCCCTRLPGKGSQERMRQSLYEKYASEDAVVENLRDAGCSSSQIECFLDWQEEERTADQLSMLSEHRKQLLDNVHREEKRIDCLDYLVYQIERTCREPNDTEKKTTEADDDEQI